MTKSQTKQSETSQTNNTLQSFFIVSLSLAIMLMFALNLPPSQASSHPASGAVTMAEMQQPTNPNAGPPAVLLLDAEALVLTNDGATTSVTAHVRDAVGAPVSGATVDFFQTTGGTTIPESAPTDGNGMISVTFTAGSAIGQALIGARINDLTQREAIQIVKPNSDATGHTLSLSVAAGKLNENEQANVTATLRDASGQPVVGELISLFGSLGEISPASGVSDSNGQVSVSYQAGNRAGIARITALSGVVADSATLQVGDPSVPQVTPAPATPVPPTATPPTNGRPTETDQTFLPFIK